MRVLVYEFLCGGGWREPLFPDSLIREGKAMFQALLEDFSRIPGVTVVTTWDTRLADRPLSKKSNIEWHPVSTPERDIPLLKEIGPTVDLGLIVAPEFQNKLRSRCHILREAGIPLLNCDDEAIRLCSDKLETFRFCSENGIPTIPTQLATTPPTEFPCVVKLRDGAGCLQMERIVSPADWERWSAIAETADFLVQPELPGRACSVGGIFRNGTVVSVLPVAEQILTRERNISYLGGRIPAPDAQRDSVVSMVRQIASVLPGLNGYVGFDLLLNPPSPPILVEMNPRVSTSYVGYRQLTEQNLAELMIHGAPETDVVFKGRVAFHTDGTIHAEIPMMESESL